MYARALGVANGKHGLLIIACYDCHSCRTYWADRVEGSSETGYYLHSDHHDGGYFSDVAGGTFPGMIYCFECSKKSNEPKYHKHDRWYVQRFDEYQFSDFLQAATDTSSA